MPKRKLSTLARWSDERTAVLRRNVLNWAPVPTAAAPRARQRVYTLLEVANALGLSKEAVRKWVLEGKLRATRRGTTYVIRRTNLSGWLDKWGRTPQGAKHVAKLAQSDSMAREQESSGEGANRGSSPPPLSLPQNKQRYSTYITPLHRAWLEWHVRHIGTDASKWMRDVVELMCMRDDDGY